MRANKKDAVVSHERDVPDLSPQSKRRSSE
jgi:hypothetical protein